MNLSVLAALLFLQAPPQQTCQPGQIVVDNEGHCCWPGQSWKRRGCSGKPFCPSGMVASRHTCVPATQPVPAQYPGYPSPDAVPAGYPQDPSQAPPSPTFPGVAPLPAHALVPVRFTAAKPDDSYEVEVLTSGMPVCKTPCELRLVPNRYKVRVKGSARFSDKLTVTNQPMDLQIDHASGGWKALGTASVVVGGVAFAGGLTATGLVYLSTEANRRETRFPTDPDWSRKRNEKMLITGGVSLAGAVVAIVGGVIGFKRSGHTGITPVGAAAAAPSDAPAPAPAPESETAPDPETAPVPEATPPSSHRDEPSFQLLGLGAAPTADGLQLGAMFAF